MQAVEASAKTREEAIQSALEELGVEMYEVDKIEILDEGSRGLFGFGARPVRVKLTVNNLPDKPVHTAKPAAGEPREERPREREGRRDRGEPRGGDRGGDRGKRPPQRPAAQENAPRRGRAEQVEQRPARGDRQDRPSRPERGERPARPDRPERQGPPPARQENRPQGPRRPSEARPPQEKRPPRERTEPKRREAEPPRRAPEPAAPALKDEDESLDLVAVEEVVSGTPVPQSREEECFEPISDELGNEAATVLREMIEKMGIEAVVTFARGEDNMARLNVESQDSALLIGRKGRNLSAMQYLINRMISQSDTAENTERLMVDVEGYVGRRRESLESMARNLADKAKATRRNMRLKPLSPQERRIIHLTLQDDPEIRTFSLGESLYRSVVISLANAAPERSGGARRQGRGGGGGGRGRGTGRREPVRAPQDTEDIDPGQFGD
jgi:spoIIIJ-associated protein